MTETHPRLRTAQNRIQDAQTKIHESILYGWVNAGTSRENISMGRTRIKHTIDDLQHAIHELEELYDSTGYMEGMS